VTRGAGGSGANTVYALAKLGLDTCVIGIVTEDPDGRYLRDSFASAGVGMDFLFATGEGSTGRTTILTTGPQRTIIVEPGSNNLLHAHFARQREPIFEALDRTRLLHLTSFAGERERNLQLELIARLPSDALLAFTPGSIQSKQGLEGLQQILKRVNIMFIYENDLATLIDPSSPRERGSIDASIKRLFEWKARQGGKQPLLVVVKNNARAPQPDALYFSLYYGTDHPRGPFNTAGLELNGNGGGPVDTTGAGDAYAAGVIYALLTTECFDNNMLPLRKIAHRMAHYAASRVGARAGLPAGEAFNPPPLQLAKVQ
jgi:sugar/nucleoside kinase (ribokinase family)